MVRLIQDDMNYWKYLIGRHLVIELEESAGKVKA